MQMRRSVSPSIRPSSTSSRFDESRRHTLGPAYGSQYRAANSRSQTRSRNAPLSRDTRISIGNALQSFVSESGVELDPEYLCTTFLATISFATVLILARLFSQHQCVGCFAAHCRWRVPMASPWVCSARPSRGWCHSHRHCIHNHHYRPLGHSRDLLWRWRLLRNPAIY